MSEPRSTQAALQETQPRDPQRVRAFAEFFKRYMSLSTLVVAALPIPVTAIQLIPTYDAQTKLLATYATMLCFLMLGFIFSVRHAIARSFFPQVVRQGMLIRSSSAPDEPGESIETYLAKMSDQALEERFQELRAEGARLGKDLIGRYSPLMAEWNYRRKQAMKTLLLTIVPALFVILTLLCIFLYHETLRNSLFISYIERPFGDRPSDTLLLNETPSYAIPDSTKLMLFYLGIFVFAESAFIIMAIKEYLQDLVGLDDIELISGRQMVSPVPETVSLEKSPGEARRTHERALDGVEIEQQPTLPGGSG